MSEPPDKRDPTMQFPLAIQVCRRLVTILEKMLFEKKEIDREQWDSLLKNARSVVNLADNAPAESELVPRMTDTVRVKIEPEDPLGPPMDGRTLKIDFVDGRPMEKKKAPRLAMLIAAVCLVVLGVEIWMYVDLRGQIEIREDLQAVEQDELPGPVAEAEVEEEIPELLHRAAAGKPKKRSSRRYGYLIVSTRPWSKVFIDDKDTGRVTPVVGLDRLKLSAGEHKVTFVTEKGDRFVYFVTIEAGKEKRLVTTLE